MYLPCGLEDGWLRKEKKGEQEERQPGFLILGPDDLPLPFTAVHSSL